MSLSLHYGPICTSLVSTDSLIGGEGLYWEARALLLASYGSTTERPWLYILLAGCGSTGRPWLTYVSSSSTLGGIYRPEQKERQVL